jgi:hypothetical protein
MRARLILAEYEQSTPKRCALANELLTTASGARMSTRPRGDVTRPLEQHGALAEAGVGEDRGATATQRPAHEVALMREQMRRELGVGDPLERRRGYDLRAMTSS